MNDQAHNTRSAAKRADTVGSTTTAVTYSTASLVTTPTLTSTVFHPGSLGRGRVMSQTVRSVASDSLEMQSSDSVETPTGPQRENTDIQSLILFMKAEGDRQERLRREEQRLRREEADRQENLRREEMRQMREETRDLIQTLRMNGQGTTDRIRKPQLKLPELKDNQDVDEFLAHFDATAKSYGLTDEEKILHLNGSLTDRAREVVFSLPSETTYAEIQTALRKHYYLSAEAYRQQFREAKKRSDETFIRFGERLKRLLNRWVELSSLSLQDLVLVEQLQSGISADLTTRIREQKPKTFEEVIEFAETYAVVLIRRHLPGKAKMTLMHLPPLL